MFPFIFVRSKNDVIPWVINHERIHIRQQLELLIVGSIILYSIEFLWALLWLRYSWRQSYLYTSAEQEAYGNQNNLDYLKHRKIFSQFTFLVNKKKFSHQDGVVIYL